MTGFPIYRLSYTAYPWISRGGQRVPLALKRGLALLVLLADAGQPLARTRLAHLLWSNVDDDVSRARLRRLMHQVNSVLGEDLVQGDASQVWLDPSRKVQTDVTAVRLLAAACLESSDAGQSRFDALATKDAERVLDGLVIDSEAFEEWLDRAREEHGRLLVQALARHASGALRCGRFQAAASAASAILRVDPLSDTGYCLQIEASGALGNAAAVEGQYFECAETMRRELGIRPSARIEQAYANAQLRLRGGASTGMAAGTLPPIRYAETPGGAVAFLELGESNAPLGTLLILFGIWSHVEIAWEEPSIRAILQRLARSFHVALVDRRGVGLSERISAEQTISDGIEDLLAVRSALGGGRVWVFGNSLGGAIAAALAARHPDVVRGLFLYAANARSCKGEDYPWAPTKEQFERWVSKLRDSWTESTGLDEFAPSAANNETASSWWNRMLRHGTSARALFALLENLSNLDVRSELPKVSCPTLVVQRKGDRVVRAGAAKYLAENIPGARLILLSGEDHLLWHGESDAVVEALEAFAHS